MGVGRESPVFKDVMNIKAVRRSSTGVPDPSKPGLFLWARILGFVLALYGLPQLQRENAQ